MSSEQSKKQLKSVKDATQTSAKTSAQSSACPCPTSGAAKEATASVSDAVQTTSTSLNVRPETCAPSSQQSAKQSATVRNSDASQLCSTLAIGQLIASNKPSAGSRLVANELRNLSNTLKEESKVLRKEISTLAGNFATTLKTLLDEDREAQNMGNLFSRRPIFGQFPFRRVPVFRRPRRVSLQFARKSLSNASTNTSPPSTSPGAPNAHLAPTAAKSDATQNSVQNRGALKSVQTANKSTAAHSSLSPAAVRAWKTTTNKTIPELPPPMPVFKSPWFPSDQSAGSYDGETDTDSTETSPGSPT